MLVGLVTLVSAINEGNVVLSNNNDFIANATIRAAAEKFFKNLLKKPANGESVEENNFKIIQDEHELKVAFCNLYNKSNDTDGFLDKRDRRMLTEIRKLNGKLIKIDEKLNEMDKNMEVMIKREINAMKEELMRNIRNGLN